MLEFQVRSVAALDAFVDRLWGWESEPGERVALPTLLPGTGAELYFHYRRPFSYRSAEGDSQACPLAHLLCVRRRPLVLCPAEGVGFIVIRFRAGMVHRFTRVPGSELMDRILPASDLWGPAGDVLAQRVGENRTLTERLELIQLFLLRCLHGGEADCLVEHAIDALYRESASIAIETLAGRYHLGPRQFERRLRAVTGQSPVEFRRLGRFQKAIRTLLLTPTASPLAVALDQGYYDQSHFSRDCRDLALASPGRLVQAARDTTHFYKTSNRLLTRMASPFSPS